MKLGIIPYSNDPETAFQAFRLGTYAAGQGDEVNVFLLAKGVECEDIDTPEFKVSEMIHQFLEAGGRTYSCTSCLKIRKKDSTEVCPLSTLGDLYRIIKESDRTVSF
jgi:uncharacterized protein involved in oxidation of intracellular sulfur